ncbi:MAG: hypothetical protein AMXMBFR56_66170 [Polyangiaceae bacterium]
MKCAGCGGEALEPHVDVRGWPWCPACAHQAWREEDVVRVTVEGHECLVVPEHGCADVCDPAGLTRADERRIEAAAVEAWRAGKAAA